MIDKLLTKFWKDFARMDELSTEYMVSGSKVAIIFAIVSGIAIVPIAYVISNLLFK